MLRLAEYTHGLPPLGVCVYVSFSLPPFIPRFQLYFYLPGACDFRFPLAACFLMFGLVSLCGNA